MTNDFLEVTFRDTKRNQMFDQTIFSCLMHLPVTYGAVIFNVVQRIFAYKMQSFQWDSTLLGISHESERFTLYDRQLFCP